jgi:hypothetical protein
LQHFAFSPFLDTLTFHTFPILFHLFLPPPSLFYIRHYFRDLSYNKEHTPMADFLLEENPMLARQLALEAEMVSRGTARFRKKVESARADGLESTTHYGSYLVRRAIKPVPRGKSTA